MFYFQQIQEINLYKSSILDDESLIHAFTTRTGGNTPPPLESFSMGTAQNPELLQYIESNRKKLCEALNLNYENLIIPEQKHTDNIKIVSSATDNVSDCDALITETPGLILMLLFADCVPVIIYAPDKKIISVVHAGWRGTAESIVQKTLTVFAKEFNADVNKIKAVIGPAIGQCCYPVSNDVSEKLKCTISNKINCDNIFTHNINDNNLTNVDLKKLNAVQLEEFGVKNIDKSENCTSCTNNVFYSYRAQSGQTGRHAALASIKNN